MPYYFYLKSEWFPLVSVLNKFIKMYSNTISIVHSNFRKKEPLYYLFRPYFCKETDTGFRDLQFSLVLVHQNWLRHFKMKLLEVELQLKAKLKVAIMIPPTLWPTAAWGSRWWTVLCLKHGKVFCWEFWWTGAIRVGLARAGSPGQALASCLGW